MDASYKLYYVINDVLSYSQFKQAGAKQCLISFFYLRKNQALYDLLVNDKDINIVVDSGLYSFFNSVEINEIEARKYSEEYIKFVSENCRHDNFVGFFELDFDLIGLDYYEFVKPYQARLLELTDKIILIMQKKRTMQDLDEMLEKDIKTIAIPFSSNKERKYFDYISIIDKAHSKNKGVHLLGCATVKYLPLCEQSDSNTWQFAAAFGEQIFLIDGKLKRKHWKNCPEVSTDYRERRIRNVQSLMQMEQLISQIKHNTKED